MRRLRASLHADLLAQHRMGLPYAVLAAGILAAFLPGLPGLPPARGFPAHALGAAFAAAFLGGGWQMLGENRESSLARLCASPLRPHEYLASKSALAALWALPLQALLALSARVPFDPVRLAAGAVGLAVLLTLAAFPVAIRFRSPVAFLLASCAAAGPLLAPLLAPDLGFGARWWAYLHPFHGPLSLLRGAVSGGSWAEAALGAAATGAWALAFLMLGKRAMARARSALPGT